jgi:hypothetical protein
VLEAPGRIAIDSPLFSRWYFDSFLAFTADLKDTLETSAAWSRDRKRKQLMINIANVWDDAYVDRDAADILLLEFQYNPVRICGKSAVEKAFERDAKAARAGIASFYSASMTRTVAGKPDELPLASVMLGNFAWYLLTRSPTTIFYQQGTATPTTAGWDTLTWRPVMAVAASQLGEAVGPPYTLVRGVDPLGNAYAVQARRYDRGLVVLRNRGNSKEGVEPATAAEFDLPAPLSPLHPSGAILPAVERLRLRNGEGGILLGDPGPGHQK